MDHLDQETMDAAGDFLLELGVVPRTWVDEQQPPIKLCSDDYRSPSAIWWRRHECQLDVRRFCDARWTRIDPIAYFLRDDLTELSWSDDNNHRIEIIEDESGSIVEFSVAIDIRTAYSDFIDSIIEISEQAQAVFFDFGNEAIFEPSRGYIIDVIQQHQMSHVVFDSTGQLKFN